MLLNSSDCVLRHIPLTHNSGKPDLLPAPFRIVNICASRSRSKTVTGFIESKPNRRFGSMPVILDVLTFGVRSLRV